MAQVDARRAVPPVPCHTAPPRQVPDGHTPAMICAHTTESVSYAHKHRSNVFLHHSFHVTCAYTPLTAKMIAHLKSNDMCNFCVVDLTPVSAQYKVFTLKARVLWIMTYERDVAPDTWKSSGIWHFQSNIDVVAKHLLNSGTILGGLGTKTISPCC